jgi:hypothetical protein
LDASESFWFARELESIKAQILVREIPEFKGRSLVPVASGVPAGSAVYTYQELDEVGIAQFVNGFAKDLPRVDVVGRETSSPIRPIGASYGYTTANIRQALPLAKAEAAMRAIEAKIDLTCQVGDVPQGIRGLFTLTGVNTYVIPNGGAGSPLWSTKTADEILADLQGFGHRASVVTNEVHPSDTIAMSIDQYNIISTKRINSASDRTVLEHFLATSPYIKQIVPWYACVGRGASASTRMVAFRRDPMCIEQIVPMEYTQSEPQPDGLSYVVPCEAEVGGVVAYRPLSITYADGA